MIAVVIILFIGIVIAWLLALICYSTYKDEDSAIFLLPFIICIFQMIAFAALILLIIKTITHA
jgi:hypothetical protein